MSYFERAYERGPAMGILARIVLYFFYHVMGRKHVVGSKIFWKTIKVENWGWWSFWHRNLFSTFFLPKISIKCFKHLDKLVVNSLKQLKNPPKHLKSTWNQNNSWVQIYHLKQSEGQKIHRINHTYWYQNRSFRSWNRCQSMFSLFTIRVRSFSLSSL